MLLTDLARRRYVQYTHYYHYLFKIEKIRSWAERVDEQISAFDISALKNAYQHVHPTIAVFTV
jgi:hypothetical protein